MGEPRRRHRGRCLGDKGAPLWEDAVLQVNSGAIIHRPSAWEQAPVQRWTAWATLLGVVGVMGWEEPTSFPGHLCGPCDPDKPKSADAFPADSREHFPV